MPKRAITQLFLDRIKPPKVGRVEYWDAAQPGLHLRVSANGNQSWAVMYRIKDKQVRQTIGTVTDIPKVSQARVLAEASIALAKEGVNPVQKKRDEARTAEGNSVADAARRFLQYVDGRCRPATLRAYRQMFNHDIVPAWGQRPVSSITDGDVLVLLNKKRANRERKRKDQTGGAGIMANRLLSGLHTFFKWCMAAEQKLITANPASGIENPVKEKPRDRVLNGEEIKAFWLATREWNGEVPFGSLFRLMLLTAQRKSEVGGMRWGEIDTDKRRWTIPKERAKNGKEHIVHLSDLAMEVLKSIPRIEDRDLLFSRRGQTAASGFGRAKALLDNAMLPLLPEPEGWVLHDLRRTATTIMAELKIPPHVCDKVLNHTAGQIRGVAAVYNRFEYLDERQAALDALGRYIAKLIDPDGAGNVVPLRGSMGA